eukprot:scaffold9061_cov236-Skeletonema_marinoi.AAC.2
MEREQLKTAVSSQRARYSIVSNTAVGYGSIGTGRTNCTHRIGVCAWTSLSAKLPPTSQVGLANSQQYNT